MARIRSIKPEFFYDEHLAELDPSIRLFFIGLWTCADRAGRLDDSPKRLKAQLMPYDNFDSDAALNILSERFIIRYISDGRRYIQIINFLKHQIPHYKEIPSVIPPPTEHKDSKYNAAPVKSESRDFVFERDGGKCRQCGSSKSLSIDHIKPRSEGGGPEVENLQVLCVPCNSSKKNKYNPSSNQHQLKDELTLTQCGTQKGKERKGKEGNGYTKPPKTTPRPDGPISNVQAVVEAYKTAKGISGEDKAWDKANFARFAKAASALLASTDCLENAIAYISARGSYLSNQGLEWTLETIAKNAADKAPTHDLKPTPKDPYAGMKVYGPENHD